MYRSVNTASVPELNPIREDLQNELLRLLFAVTPIVLITNLINGTLIAVVFIKSNTPPLVGTWWVCLLIMVAVRTAVHIWYRKRGVNNRRGVQIAIVGSGVSGLIWGTAGLMFYSPAGETQRMVLGFVLGGMGAGAVAALTPCLPAFYAYLFPAVVPFCVRLTLEGDVDHLTMAATCVLYLVALVVLGRRANAWLTESISRRFDNAELIRSLECRVEERTAELKEVNEHLHRDISERRRAEASLENYGHRQATIADFGQIALSGIDLDTLFSKAVVLVRERLAVVRAVVIEEPLDTQQKLVRAEIGPERSLSRGACTALADHPQPIIHAMGSPLNGEAIDRSLLHEPAEVAEAVISGRDRPFGVLLAFDNAPRQFSMNDIAFLKSIANMLAAAIERKRAEHDIQRLALQDPLTGLPNRSLFQDQLHQELARATRFTRMVAVLLLDLDHFKDVNDALGHPTGDRLLAAAAGRIKGCLRKADVAARLGGDEFAVVLSDLRSPEDAAFVARKLVSRLAEPFLLDRHEIHIGASIGITISPCDAADVDGLLRTADLALYHAKTQGRNTYEFFAKSMAVQVEARKTLEHDLRHALRRGELFIEYQPQFDLATKQIIGAEALLRWRHPMRGVLLPDDFIPTAEATGLIIPLGRWVLECVAKQMHEWRAANLPPILIAINVSLSQCRHGDLDRAIGDIASHTAWDLGRLELEVTEQLFLAESFDNCVATLRRLSNLGVTISIDDFGTGYSSLGRLRLLPVDKVKIDKSFVAEVGIDRDAEAIVRAIIALARSLEMTVTAEGVENDRQLTFLIAEGCDHAQGYHLCVPLPHHEFAAVLRNNWQLWPAQDGRSD